MTVKKYWIGVASRDHVERGMELGVCMLCHGKRAPLARMKQGDGLLYYAPYGNLEKKDPLQAFVAVGFMADEEMEQVCMSSDFYPFRRKIQYEKDIQFVPIRPLLPLLEFVEDPSHWGYKFRFGHFEISQHDFELIHKQMKFPNG